ncbi:MAG TPA: TonB-dependent receptor [Bacteroidales bacterium]|nr:TonB-dependent receptor [Bacteroidales bacterium]
MKKTPNYLWLLRPFVAILLFCGIALAAFPSPDDQQVRVTGKITDESGAGMPGVNIQVKGSTIGIITDENGQYSVNVPDSKATLVFSFIGYVTQEVALDGRTTVDVALKAEVTGLDEVVVVGYGTQKRANVVGAVASISGAAIQTIPSTSVTTAIAGRLPGVTLWQTTGEPGNLGAQILIRGRNTISPSNNDSDHYRNTGPLVIIDGVQGRSMDEIDPMDIASLSVLKDASAAIYGASAANGVILITTKNGQEGKPKLNYQFYQGFMTPTVIPETTNAGEYATMLSEYQDAQGIKRTYSDQEIQLFFDETDPWRHPNTDWYGDLIKNWTTTYRHNLTIDGGAKGMLYYVSLGLKGDESFYKQSTTAYKQYNVRAKVDMPINDWLKAGLDIAGFLTDRIYPYKSADAIVGQSTRLLPTQWSFWPNGLPGPDIEYGDNPVVTSTFAGGKNDQKTYRLQNTFDFTITPPFVKGLSLNGSYSYDLTNYYNKAFYKPWILYFPNTTAPIDPETGLNVTTPLVPQSRGLSSAENNERYDRTINQTANLNLTFSRKFGDHNLTLYAGYEQYTNDYNRLVGYRKYYISDLIQTMDAGSDTEKNTTGYATIYARKSWIGRATYDFKGKYLAEFLFRRDGSLKFPPKSRWGNFPGILLGWRTSEEGFWKDNIPVINYFKLRASYGQMGSDPGDPFQYMNKFGLTSGMMFGTGTSIETVVGPPVIANPKITWETQTSENIGFDSKFLNDLFHLNFEYFYNKRDDILWARDATVPGYSGLSLPNENIARVDNQGYELDFGVHKNLNSDLRIDASFNFSHNRSKVVFMDEPETTLAWQRREGKPFVYNNENYMYKAIGIFADEADLDKYPHLPTARPGDVIFEDVSGDGQINDDDRILLDKFEFPQDYYAINLDVTYKNFTLSTLVQGQGEFWKMNYYDNRRGVAGNYFKWHYDNRWTPDNIHTDVARAYNRDDLYWSNDVKRNSYWYANFAFARLKNLVLTYNIPSRFYKPLGIQNASVYFSGNNLALLYAKTKTFDPEVNNPGVYPAMKTFAIGANITF